MGYQIYENRGRWAGYGVPAYCDYPGCKEEIDRGMSYACGGEPFSEIGCDRYFCSKHTRSGAWNEDEEEWCKHEDDCECEYHDYCFSCLGLDKEYPLGYPPAVEHPEWVFHLLNHHSWEEWRNNNPDEVVKLKKLPATKPEYWENKHD